MYSRDDQQQKEAQTVSGRVEDARQDQQEAEGGRHTRIVLQRRHLPIVNLMRIEVFLVSPLHEHLHDEHADRDGNKVLDCQQPAKNMSAHGWRTCSRN